jgi:hypothetical protein
MGLESPDLSSQLNNQSKFKKKKMKRLILLTVMAACILTASAQQDSTKNSSNDTMRIGNILIIKKGKKNDSDTSWERKGTTIQMGRNGDQTNYGATGNYLVNRPGSPAFSKSDFKLRTGKSINVNIWFFMQRLSLIKRNVNLKYGLGLELNNYRFKAPLTFSEGGTIPYSGGVQTNSPFIFRDSISFSKNKLAADYLTVPLMLNFSTNRASKSKGLSISAGVSAGYLYSQRNKQKSDANGKEKNKGEYDLEKFKLSYIGELGLGPVKLYGSYSPKSMFENGLDMRPFTIGFRLSNW